MSSEQSPQELHGDAKRQKVEYSSPFLSNNKFAVLSDATHEENMSTDVSSNTAFNQSSVVNTEKKASPPPIFISNLININQLITDLKQMKVGPFKHYTISNNEVKLNLETIDHYRETIKYLEANNAEFHTFQMKSERPFRVVIRGLHPSSDVAMLKEELTELGFEPLQMLPVHHPVTKIPCPLFFLDLKPNLNNYKVYEVTRLYGAVVKIEPPKPKRVVIQCTKCQAYGHSKNYCHKTPRCVKCDQHHETSKCIKDPRTPPICVNCKGQHTANYKGCPVHKNLQNASRYTPKSNNNNNISSNRNGSEQTQPEAKASNNPRYTTNVSYAHAVNPNNNSEDSMIGKLMDKIDSLLSLFAPLMNTLQQVLSCLMNRK